MMASKLEPSLLRSWSQSYLYLCVFLISSLQSFSPAVMATLYLIAVCVDRFAKFAMTGRRLA